MGRRQNTDIAPRIRGAFIRACEINEKKGKGLTELIAEKLADDPLNTLKAMAAFNPRQMQLDITAKVEVSEIIALAHQRQNAIKDVTPPKVEDKGADKEQTPNTPHTYAISDGLITRDQDEAL